jgi:hypothetical protein
MKEHGIKDSREQGHRFVMATPAQSFEREKQQVTLKERKGIVQAA